MDKIQVGIFFQDTQSRLKIRLTNSPRGLVRDIPNKDLHRPGLALAGFLELFTHARIQILGNTEIRYLRSLSESARKESLAMFFQFEIPCIIVSNSNELPPELPAMADAAGVSIFVSPFSTTELTHLLSDSWTSMERVYSLPGAAASANRKSLWIWLSAVIGSSVMMWLH
jgi:HPr kinase/phosphorylase